MPHLPPSGFVPKLIDNGEARIVMSASDTPIRACLAGDSENRVKVVSACLDKVDKAAGQAVPVATQKHLAPQSANRV